MWCICDHFQATTNPSLALIEVEVFVRFVTISSQKWGGRGDTIGFDVTFGNICEYLITSCGQTIPSSAEAKISLFRFDNKNWITLAGQML